MATRFVQAKVDKYIQLYSKFGKNEGTTYDLSIISIQDNYNITY